MLAPFQDRESCECGWLQRAATDPDHPVKFDHRLNEFSIVKGDRSIRIYHCPFCGGKTPESLRATLFAHVSTDEQERLLRLGAAVESIAQVLTKLGRPNRDDPVGAVIGTPDIMHRWLANTDRPPAHVSEEMFARLVAWISYWRGKGQCQ